MGRTVSSKAESQLNDIISRFVDFISQPVRGREFRGQLFPTLVVAKETIAPGGAGKCAFLRGKLDGARVEIGDEEETMYNLVSERTIEAGDECLATRVALPFSEDGGWVIQRQKKQTNSQGAEYQCSACSDGIMPAISLGVTGLADTSDDKFDGWAAVSNGTYDMVHGGVDAALLIGSPCTPALKRNTPANGAAWSVFGQPDDRNKSLIFQFVPSFFNAVPELEAYIVAESSILGLVKYQENHLSQFTRGTDGRIDCSATYSDWQVQGSSGQYGPALQTWLSAGTFEINP